jgi:hypothetical protein
MKVSNLQEALQVASFLEKHLCKGCGFRLAEWASQFRNVCTTCLPGFGEYSRIEGHNELVTGLCNGLREWVESHSQGNRKDPGDPADTCGAV